MILYIEKNLKKIEKKACIFRKDVVLYLSSQAMSLAREVGVDYNEGPPVPIPNTEVKLVCAEDTWLETAWENRFSPTLKSSIHLEAAFFICISKKPKRPEKRFRGEARGTALAGPVPFICYREFVAFVVSSIFKQALVVQKANDVL